MKQQVAAIPLLGNTTVSCCSCRGRVHTELAACPLAGPLGLRPLCLAFQRSKSLFIASALNLKFQQGQTFEP